MHSITQVHIHWSILHNINHQLAICSYKNLQPFITTVIWNSTLL